MITIQKLKDTRATMFEICCEQSLCWDCPFCRDEKRCSLAMFDIFFDRILKRYRHSMQPKNRD